ncbi:MAG: PDZ domain-containing protein, partial [Candidatus Latescibacteria bacterium]|nr:PDZ domain-containing protein [Candidatus Latescibacterota bacterium]
MVAPTQESLRAQAVVAHPPIEVWRAFTRPEHLHYWFGDAGEIDLRVGGAFVVRASSGLKLDATIERLVEGRRLVLRPTRCGDDARIEVDFVKLAGAETRISVTHPDAETVEGWRDALENLRSVWDDGIDLRESRAGVMGIGPRGIDSSERPIPGVHDGLGVRLAAVLSGGPAEKAGLRSGDVVISFNGAALRSETELVERIRSCRPGMEVAVQAVRDGRPVNVTVTLAQRPGRGSPPPAP